MTRKQKPDNQKPELSEETKETIKKVKSYLTPTFKIKDKYKEVKEQQGRKPLKRGIKVIVVLLAICTVALLFSSTYTNKQFKQLAEARDTRLDTYELTKLAVLTDVTRWLTVVTKEDYKSSRSAFKAPDWYKDELFGKKFNPKNFYGATSVEAIDVQYTFPDDQGVIKYYLLLNVTRGDTTKQHEILVFVQGNEIFDILVV